KSKKGVGTQKCAVLLVCFIVGTRLLLFTGRGRVWVWELLSRKKKTGWGGVLVKKEKLKLCGGGFSPATPEWLSLNAPLSMARALRAIAFSP
ncbi:hypothetical protein LN406_20300, partial [Enterobacter hormaechei subsp. steigerwaltii]|uniref:hypothetical protein n=1 Tax=Enterobacter hormaechei TaxID=158836 RepID=UPI001E426730